LKSRNGTLINGERIDPDVPRQLAHHDILQIGKYAFRISIRDARTKKPHEPFPVDLSTLSGAPMPDEEQIPGIRGLLSELDDLASKLSPSGSDDEADRPSSSTTLGVKQISATSETDSAVSSPKQEEDEEAASEETVLVVKSSEKDEEPASDEDEESDTPDSTKLPKHLLPKGPKDSQDAATKALKNMFVR
ncbi:MAG: FHA domain-containing protein, partial [Planctomycetota bacterium]